MCCSPIQMKKKQRFQRVCVWIWVCIYFCIIVSTLDVIFIFWPERCRHFIQMLYSQRLRNTTPHICQTVTVKIKWISIYPSFTLSKELAHANKLSKVKETEAQIPINGRFRCTANESRQWSSSGCCRQLRLYIIRKQVAVIKPEVAPLKKKKKKCNCGPTNKNLESPLHHIKIRIAWRLNLLCDNARPNRKYSK